MATDKMTLVDKKMPNKKQFLALFPWKKIVKFYFLFLLYILIASVIFFSTEECLREKLKTMENQLDYPAKHPVNCTEVPISKVGIHTNRLDEAYDGNETKPERNIIFDLICDDKIEKEEAKPWKSCQITFEHVLRWIYFVVVHLHGSDTTSFHLTSKWGQIISGPIIVVGIALAMRLYTIVGFVSVNFIHYGVRKLRQRFRRFKVTVKHDILVITTVLFIAYILCCGAVSMIYVGEQRTYGETVFQWTMVFLAISDENLFNGEGVNPIANKTPQTTQLILMIILIFIGFPFAMTFFAAIVNTMYRLTYNLNAQTKPKKGSLQGWWV